jgi:tetratricopeptide (TPR) repeat protein
VPGRSWTAIGLAFCAIAGAGTAGAQTIWDDPPFALYRQAVEAMERKDYGQASELAARAAAQYPANVLAHYLRGQASAAQSRWADAAAAFTRVTELYPASFAGWRDLGASYEQLDKMDAAARAYEAALKLRDQESLRVRLAFALMEAGQQPRALAELKTLTDRDSKLPEVWTAFGRVAYEGGDLATSEKAYTRAVTLRDDGATWFNLAVIRARAGNLSGALQAFENAAKHAEVRTQAESEAGRIREALRKERAPSSSLPAPPTRIDSTDPRR